MFRRIASFTFRFRFWIVGFWLVAAGLLYLLAPALSQVSSITEANFLPANSESLRARELIARYFPATQSASTVTLVFFDPRQINAVDRAYAQQVSDWLGSGSTSFKVNNVTSVFVNPALESRLVSPDRTTMLVNAGLDTAAFESGSLTAASQIRAHLQSIPSGLQIYVSGEVGVYSDLFDSLNKTLTLTTVITMVLVILLLMAIFRSPVAALVPLATVGISFVVARGLTAFIGQAGVPVWSQIEIFLIVLIFGVGTDYCLFLISRYREELERQTDRRAALETAVTKIGVVISASAFAVIAGLAGMAVAHYQMIQTMGPLLGVAILITLLAALTLTPALAAIAGRQLFWPRRTTMKANRPHRAGIWDRIAAISTGRPLVVIGVVVLVLLLPFLALPSLHSSFDQMAEIPASSDSVAGYNILKKHYDIGAMDPLSVVLKAPAGQNLTSPAALNSLLRISGAITQVPGVVKVESLLQPDGQTTAGFTVSGQLSAIGQGLEAGLASSQTNPATLTTNATAGLKQLGAYLNELAQNFAWVKTDAVYNRLAADFSSLQQMVTQLPAVAGNSATTAVSAALTQAAGTLSTDLQDLAREFVAAGNPVFLSPTLLASSSQSAALLNLFFSPDRQATLMYVVLNAYPQSDGALNAVDGVRTALASEVKLTSLAGAETAVGGTSAELNDVRHVIDQDFSRILIVELVAIFIVLGLLLRSLIAPLYLLLTVLLSYGATLGLVSWIFQDILGQDGVSFLIPIFVLVLLIALGSDYNIFLMSRVREESQTRPTLTGTRLAAIATGGVITACGIILAGTFGALVITPIRTMMQIGAAVAIGVLIDTFIVRAWLVPAIASRLGRWNWWPAKRG